MLTQLVDVISLMWRIKDKTYTICVDGILFLLF